MEMKRDKLRLINKLEKEPLYYVINGAEELMLVKREKSNFSSLVPFESAVHSGVLGYFQFTEKEIKEYDPRYWPFAEPVEEWE